MTDRMPIMPVRSSDTARLHRVRSGARATLTLGIGASLATNMLAAHPSVVGRVIAAWPPVALLLTVELLSRVPVGTGWLSGLRVVAAGCIALIAAWVSYWHMVEVALAYGEASAAAHLLPVSVDGLVVVASVSLVEITRRLNAGQPKRPTAKAPKLANGGQRWPTDRPVATPAANGQRPVATGPANGQRPVAAKKARALRVYEANPTWSPKRIAAEADVPERSVRRYIAEVRAAEASPESPTLTAVPTPSREAHG